MSSPSACSRTRATKSRTTVKLTSASSRARRISRIAREIDSSSSFPFFRRSPRAPWSLSDRLSNTTPDGSPLVVESRERACYGEPVQGVVAPIDRELLGRILPGRLVDAERHELRVRGSPHAGAEGEPAEDGVARPADDAVERSPG